MKVVEIKEIYYLVAMEVVKNYLNKGLLSLAV